MCSVKGKERQGIVTFLVNIPDIDKAFCRIAEHSFVCVDYGHVWILWTQSGQIQLRRGGRS